MKNIFVAFGVLASLVACSAANAAMIENISGGVKVNRGEGFSPLSGSTDLAPGDRVMVGKGGSASLVYADGCRVSLMTGVTTVPAKSPCSFRAQAGGADDLLGGINPMYAIGGLLVVGGIAGGLAASSGGGCTNKLVPISGGAVNVCN